MASVISLWGNGVSPSGLASSILHLCKSVFICGLKISLFAPANLHLCKSVFICGFGSASLHLPIFDELVRNFFQKSRGALKNVAVAASQTHMRICKIESVFRAGDRDIKQAALFF